MQNIKHLVISSGGIYLFQLYGAIKESFLNSESFELKENNKINIHNIETICASSAGTMIAILIGLIKSVSHEIINWEWIDHYMKHRRFEQYIPSDISVLISLLHRFIQSYGLYDHSFFYDMLYPIFIRCQISMDISLDEFEKKTGIHYFFCITKCNSQELKIADSNEFGAIPIFQLACASCSVPFIFTPVQIGEDFFIDGAITQIFPYKQHCRNLDLTEESPSIFGFYVNHKLNSKEYTNIFEYIYLFIYNCVFKNQSDNFFDKSNYNILFLENETISMSNTFSILTDGETRMQLVESGKKQWSEFIKRFYSI